MHMINGMASSAHVLTGTYTLRKWLDARTLDRVPCQYMDILCLTAAAIRESPSKDKSGLYGASSGADKPQDNPANGVRSLSTAHHVLSRYTHETCSGNPLRKDGRLAVLNRGNSIQGSTPRMSTRHHRATGTTEHK